MFSPLTQRLIEALQELPGVGPKSAQRLAFHLLGKSGRNKGANLSQSLKEAIDKVVHCQMCRIFSENELCTICNNCKRDSSLLCVVETPADVVAIEQTHIYSGRYFVLHGHLSPLDGIGPNDLGIPRLLDYLQNASISELILATNPTMEGRATAHYIANHIDPNTIKCSRIAHGVPLGGELEYLDGGTLTHAFHSRLPLEIDN